MKRIGRRERGFVLDALAAFIKRAAPPNSAGVRWAQVKTAVDVYSLGPLFHETLAPDRAPEALLARWARTRDATFARNARAEALLAGLFADLDAAGVPAVTFRGLSLCHTIYGDASLRPMNDVDVLVRLADRDAAAGVMAAHGHALIKRGRMQWMYDMAGMRCELHWSPLTTRRFRRAAPTQALIDSRRRIDTDGGTLYVPAPAYELIGLVMHAFVHHRLDRLWQLVDIALTMRRPDLDRAAVAAWCRGARIGRMVRFTLAFADHLFALGGPPVRWQRAFERRTEWLFGDDSLLAYAGRKHTELFVAERPADIARQILRWCSLDELHHLAQSASLLPDPRFLPR